MFNSNSVAMWYEYVFCRQAHTNMHAPVEGGYGADGEQQVEQGLGRIGQWVVLVQQIGQRGHLLACQHIHHYDVPHSITCQETVREQTDHPAEDEHTETHRVCSSV